MNGYFEEYGWSVVSIIGGFIGLGIFLAAYFTDGSQFSSLMQEFVGKLI